MSKRARTGPAVKPKAGREGLNTLDEGVLVTFVRRPFKQSEAGQLFQQLQREKWEPRKVTVYGKTVRAQRAPRA